jgi:16S rRNA (cytosine1402-N4)-methyltransferase
MAHIPVLLQEILHHLSPKDGGVYVDCTFGAGGYTRAILSAANCKVIAFDRDSNVQKFADSIAKDFPERFVFHNVENALIGEILENVAGTIDGIVYDLGVSSMQIDTAERGFSFQEDGPLDMRMDTLQTLTAEHIVNEFSEAEIANIIYQFGDERKSRVIAHAIIDYRQNQRITKTMELARIVQSVLKQGRSEINVATKNFPSAKNICK